MKALIILFLIYLSITAAVSLALVVLGLLSHYNVRISVVSEDELRKERA